MYFLHLWRLYCGSCLAVLEINDLIDFLRLEFHSFLAFLANHPLVTAILFLAPGFCLHFLSLLITPNGDSIIHLYRDSDFVVDLF